MKKRIVSALLILVMVISMLPATALAATTEVASGTCGSNLTWTLNNEGTLTISGIGRMAVYDSPDAVPWDVGKYEITKLVIADGVTSISDYAFYNFVDLMEVCFSESLTEIGAYAFYGCASLQSIDLPENLTGIGDYAFYGCRTIRNVFIPDMVSTLGSHVFYGCSSLEEIIIGNQVWALFEKTFANCGNLRSITLGACVNYIEDAFLDCTLLSTIFFRGDTPDTITEDAFKGVTATVYYPADDPTWTEKVMMDYSGNIEWTAYDNPGIIIAEGSCGNDLVWKIFDNGRMIISGEGAMENYQQEAAPWYIYSNKIFYLTIEEGVTSIGDYAFYNCQRIKRLTIPNTIKKVGKSAFTYCGNLSDVYISDLSSWCRIKFSDTSPGSNLYVNGTLQREIDIPDDVASIGAYTFYNKNGIRKISIPENVTFIGENAFGLGKISTVIFMGNAPEFAPDALQHLDSTTIYYPQNNNTWMDSVFESTEAKWCAYENDSNLKILVQPQDVEIKESNTVELSITVLGSGLQYQWQFLSNGSDAWIDLQMDTATEAIFSFVISVENEGMYRCKVTDKNGDSIISDEVTICIDRYKLCNYYTPKLVEDTFRYLDEMYIQQYPEMGLRFSYGTADDKQTLTDLAEVITEGCTTDREKADAIEAWMMRNLVYDENAPAYPMDVLHSKRANCFSLALLMQELLRIEGVPAVWGDGWRGSMSTSYPDDFWNSYGHAWCFVYADGEWVLYDPLWISGGTVDREYMQNWIYFNTVEGVTPVYDSNSLPPAQELKVVFYHIDGKPMKGGILLINMQVRLTGITYESGGYSYSEKETTNIAANERFRGGWIDYHGNWYHYAYENGILANNTVIAWNGKDYYMGDISAMELCVPKGEYCFENTMFTLPAGYSGQIMKPLWTEEYIESQGEWVLWESYNPDIATVDQNGVVTSLQAGYASIGVNVMSYQDGEAFEHAHVSFDVYFSDEEREYDFTDNTYEHEHVYTTIVREASNAHDSYVIYTCAEDSCANSYFVKQKGNDTCKHSFIITIPEKYATCYEPGNNPYFICVDCGQAFGEDGITKTYAEDEAIAPKEHTFIDGACSLCGKLKSNQTPGNIDGNETVDVDDVLTLLWHILFPEEYPIDAEADFDGNSEVNVDDVLTLLWHVLFPEEYPLN